MYLYDSISTFRFLFSTDHGLVIRFFVSLTLHHIVYWHHKKTLLVPPGIYKPTLSAKPDDEANEASTKIIQHAHKYRTGWIWSLVRR